MILMEGASNQMSCATKIDFCTFHVCAKLMMMANGTFVSLSIYGKLLHQLIGVKEDSEVSEELLLSLLTLREAEKDIISFTN